MSIETHDSGAQQPSPSHVNHTVRMTSDKRFSIKPTPNAILDLHLNSCLTPPIGGEKSRESAEHVSYMDIQFSDPESSSGSRSGVKYLDVDWSSLPSCLAECSGGQVHKPEGVKDYNSSSSSDVSYAGSSSRSPSPEEEIDYVLERVRTRRGSWMQSTDDVIGDKSTTSTPTYGTFLLCHGHARHHLLVPLSLPLTHTPSPETLFESIVDALSSSTDSLDDLRQWRDTVARQRRGDRRHTSRTADDVTGDRVGLPAASLASTATASILRLPLVHVTKCTDIIDDNWPMADVEGRHASLPTRGCRTTRRLRLRPQSVALSTRFMSLGRRDTDKTSSCECTGSAQLLDESQPPADLDLDTVGDLDTNDSSWDSDSEELSTSSHSLDDLLDDSTAVSGNARDTGPLWQQDTANRRAHTTISDYARLLIETFLPEESDNSPGACSNTCPADCTQHYSNPETTDAEVKQSLSANSAPNNGSETSGKAGTSGEATPDKQRHLQAQSRVERRGSAKHRPNSLVITGSTVDSSARKSNGDDDHSEIEGLQFCLEDILSMQPRRLEHGSVREVGHDLEHMPQGHSPIRSPQGANIQSKTAQLLSRRPVAVISSAVRGCPHCENIRLNKEALDSRLTEYPISQQYFKLTKYVTVKLDPL